jgi:hypothetical protein
MSPLIALAVGAIGILCFVAGAVWEGCRTGGTLDLQTELALTRDPHALDRAKAHHPAFRHRSDAAVLPFQRPGGAA